MHIELAAATHSLPAQSPPATLTQHASAATIKTAIGSGLSDDLSRACAAVYNAWIRFIPHAEAVAQAASFARRFTNVVNDNVSERELDNALERVAGAMVTR